MREHDPRPGPVGDRLLVIGVAMIVIGLGTLILGLADASTTASSARAGIIMTPSQVEGPTRVHVPSSRRWVSPDRDSPPIPKVWRQNPEARTYLLEMSARMRRTTLGADPATRDAVALDIYAYQWLGITGTVQDQTATSPLDDHVTPEAIERAVPRT